MSRRELLSILLASLFLGGCGNSRNLCEALGFCDPTPPPAVTFDIVLDGSDGSTATVDAVRSTGEAVLPVAACRPGSVVRLWWLGATVADTELLASLTVEPPRSKARKWQTTAQREFVERSVPLLVTATEGHLARPRPKRSPLAEGLTRVAWSSAPTPLRVVVLVSDGREVSRLADFECKPLPSSETWLRLLDNSSLLPEKSFNGVVIHVAFASVPPIADRRCVPSIDRETRIRALWLASLKRAGASRVTFHTGAPVLGGDPFAENGGGS
ncbi:MAG: hypothetical protein NDJ92_20925 [Thermoanaerobaculia bacterium]|nr:hypothetical protein [Thermoanaerobaculia bacterium]